MPSFITGPTDDSDYLARDVQFAPIDAQYAIDTLVDMVCGGGHGNYFRYEVAEFCSCFIPSLGTASITALLRHC
jgi:hypothetical protein